ncbi:hypothetical protein NE237_032530 [Protea cynaroides]|uniref:C2H2-type domain-containing protein n=1 Tax=Protea cynaroides TaxID=273540 RepID=A0A9Q0L360_9MAGN|nr:hypothetical protein NE237_032530 [Protea cynaroides]
MGILRPESTICRECGKGFQSWKALYGHMRCHPKRERVFNRLDDDSWINGKNQKVVMDNQSDNVTAALPPKRSRRMRYYKNDTTSSSSFASEIDQEERDAAFCLMMLSRDLGHWDGLNSVGAESSLSSSVGLDAQLPIRSSHKGERNHGKGNRAFGFSCDENENLKSLKIKKLESVVSDSGFWRVGLKKVQSKVSVHGFFRHEGLKKRKLEDGAGYVELGKDFSINEKGNRKLDCIEAELGEDSVEEAETDRAEKYDNSSSKRSRSGDASDSEKKRFECRTCNKIFHSHQALGGHRSSHKKIKACSRIESSKSSIETDVSADPTADSKLKKSCSNGTSIEEQDEETSQGPKKECHLVWGSESSNNQIILIQQQLPEIHRLLDLNLPPPEEETSFHMKSDL